MARDLNRATADGSGDEPICSARRCGAPAAWGVLWRNPQLHEPGRRKVWAACDAHSRTLREFLSARGFLREVLPLADVPAAVAAARAAEAGEEPGR